LIGCGVLDTKHTGKKKLGAGVWKFLFLDLGESPPPLLEPQLKENTNVEKRRPPETSHLETMNTREKTSPPPLRAKNHNAQ